MEVQAKTNLDKEIEIKDVKIALDILETFFRVIRVKGYLGSDFTDKDMEELEQINNHIRNIDSYVTLKYEENKDMVKMCRPSDAISLNLESLFKELHKKDGVIGELLTGDLKEKTMTFQIEENVTLKSGKYIITPIEALSHQTNQDRRCGMSYHPLLEDKGIIIDNGETYKELLKAIPEFESENVLTAGSPGKSQYFINLSEKYGLESTRLEIETKFIFSDTELVGFLNENSDRIINSVGENITAFGFDNHQGLDVVNDFVGRTNWQIPFKLISNTDNTVVLDKSDISKKI